MSKYDQTHGMSPENWWQKFVNEDQVHDNSRFGLLLSREGVPRL